MVLAAGLGQRMRPLTDRLPKPLIAVNGRPLIDRVLERLAAVGVEEAVVNLHHLGPALRAHLEGWQAPRIVFSQEEELLETGGGVAKALPLLGEAPFFVVNGDVLWLDGTTAALQRMAEHWDDARMDALLLVHATVTAHGYQGDGDFRMGQDGRLSERPERELAPYVFTGIQILSPRLFAGCAVEPFPLMDLYRRSAWHGRLYGMRHLGEWFHVGTPEDLTATEEELAKLGFHPGEG